MVTVDTPVRSSPKTKVRRYRISALRREGYGVDRVVTGEEALRLVRRGGHDLMLLDLGLPDLDGLEVCRRLRDDGHGLPVMMLTARGDELDRVVGLDVGADDYLAKPFGLAELLARIRALLRRNAPGPSPRGGDGRQLVVDPATRRATVGGHELSLTPKEFDLAAVLDREVGRVLTRERLMDEVWDENWFGSTKTLEVTVARLRGKLEDAGSETRMVTVRGVGFRLEAGDQDA